MNNIKYRHTRRNQWRHETNKYYEKL